MNNRCAHCTRNVGPRIFPALVLVGLYKTQILTENLGMVATRRGTRIEQAAKEKTMEMVEKEVVAETEEVKEPPFREEILEESPKTKTKELLNDEPEDKKEDEGVNGAVEEKEEVKVISKSERLGNYLVGFGKRVVLCTLLCMFAKLAYPELQARFWPEEPVKEGKLYILTDRSFRGHVSRGDHFVKMYAPWCGHCKAMAPTWEKVAKSPGVKGVKLSKIDCTKEEKTCKQYEVSGYPTLLYFRDGKKIEDYHGQKTEADIKKFLKKMRKTDTKTASTEKTTAAKDQTKKKSTKKNTKKKSEL